MVFTEYKKCSCEIGFLGPTTIEVICNLLTVTKESSCWFLAIGWTRVSYPRVSQYLCDTPDIVDQEIMCI